MKSRLFEPLCTKVNNMDSYTAHTLKEHTNSGIWRRARVWIILDEDKHDTCIVSTCNTKSTNEEGCRALPYDINHCSNGINNMKNNVCTAFGSGRRPLWRMRISIDYHRLWSWICGGENVLLKIKQRESVSPLNLHVLHPSMP
jgi:hypothetical protein